MRKRRIGYNWIGNVEVWEERSSSTCAVLSIDTTSGGHAAGPDRGHVEAVRYAVHRHVWSLDLSDQSAMVEVVKSQKSDQSAQIIEFFMSCNNSRGQGIGLE